MNLKDVGYVICLASIFLYLVDGTNSGGTTAIGYLAYYGFWAGIALVLYSARKEKKDGKPDDRQGGEK